MNRGEQPVRFWRRGKTVADPVSVRSIYRHEHIEAECKKCGASFWEKTKDATCCCAAPPRYTRKRRAVTGVGTNNLLGTVRGRPLRSFHSLDEFTHVYHENDFTRLPHFWPNFHSIAGQSFDDEVIGEEACHDCSFVFELIRGVERSAAGRRVVDSQSPFAEGQIHYESIVLPIARHAPLPGPDDKALEVV